MLAIAVAKYLDTQLADLTYSAPGTTGGNMTVDWMPATPNVAVSIMSEGGRTQASKLAYNLPGLQVIVRGETFAPRAAFDLAERIYAELQCLDAVVLDAGGADEVYIVGCTADQSGPVGIGRDEVQRPEYSLNFSLHTSAPTIHRPAVTA